MDNSEKRILRGHFLKTGFIDLGTRTEKSKAIAENLLHTDLWRKAETILCFLSTPEEPDLDPVIINALGNNKNVGVPLLHNRNMEFIKINSLEPNNFFMDKWGIREPVTGNLIHFKAESTLILVPGTAFGRRGERLGKGGGYYDLWFSRYEMQSPCPIGICFENQIMERIPMEPHDHRMKYICSNHAFYPV